MKRMVAGHNCSEGVLRPWQPRKGWPSDRCGVRVCVSMCLVCVRDWGCLCVHVNSCYLWLCVCTFFLIDSVLVFVRHSDILMSGSVNNYWLASKIIDLGPCLCQTSWCRVPWPTSACSCSLPPRGALSVCLCVCVWLRVHVCMRDIHAWFTCMYFVVHGHHQHTCTMISICVHVCVCVDKCTCIYM